MVPISLSLFKHLQILSLLCRRILDAVMVGRLRDTKTQRHKDMEARGELGCCVALLPRTFSLVLSLISPGCRDRSSGGREGVTVSKKASKHMEGRKITL